MPLVLTELGAAGYAFLVVGLGWVGVVCLWVLLRVGRFRMPAPVFWLAPLAMLAVGAGSAFLALGALDARLATSPFTGYALDLQRLEGLRAALFPVLVGLYLTSAGLLLSAPVVAIGNLIRAGERGAWSPAHAAGGVIGALLSPLGLLVGLDTFAVAAVASLSLAIASLRTSKGPDGRRLAAGRGMVAALGTGSLLLLGLAHPLAVRLEQVRIWTELPLPEQDAALALIGSPASTVVQDLSLAALLMLCGCVVMLPVARRVVDARASAGFVVATLLFGTGTLLTLAPLRALQEVVRPDPAHTRQVRLDALGLQLPSSEHSSPWEPGHTLTLDQYWVTADRDRLLPFKEGAPAPEDDGADLERFLRQGVGLPLVLEVDDRVLPTQLLPVLQAAHAVGFGEACIAANRPDGRLGCLRVQVGLGTAVANHLLVEPDTFVYVTDGEVQELGEGGLEAVAGPVALHLDDDLSSERMFEVLTGGLPDPLVVLPP